MAPKFSIAKVSKLDYTFEGNEARKYMWDRSNAPIAPNLMEVII